LIDVLIGSDHYWKFVTGEIRQGEQGPVAIRSKLGWLLSGSVDSSHGVGLTHTNLTLTKECIPESHEPLQDVLCTFWETKSIGITGLCLVRFASCNTGISLEICKYSKVYSSTLITRVSSK